MMKSIAKASIQSTDTHYKHLINTGNHQLIADEPEHAGGKDAGPAPYDYLLAGLAACTAITLRMYAEKKGWNLGEINIDLDLQKNREGATHIERVVHVSETLTDEQWQRLIEVAGKTPVTKTLLEGATINTERG
jgi:putative redox protein